MMVFGAILTLAVTSGGVLILAAIGLIRLRRHHTDAATPLDASCRALERDIVMALGMTFSVWTATAIALLLNPELGATPLLPNGGSYSIARGTVMLALGHCVGWGGFLVRRAVFWEGPQHLQGQSRPH